MAQNRFDKLGLDLKQNLMTQSIRSNDNLQKSRFMPSSHRREDDVAKQRTSKAEIYRRRREAAKGGEGRKQKQEIWTEKENQITQNKRNKRRLKWTTAEKQKWVLRSEREFAGKSKASSSVYDPSSSSSLLVGLEKSKRVEDGATNREAVDVVVCNSMNESIEEVHICNSKEKDELIFCIGKGVQMKLRAETGSALLEELRLHRASEQKTDKELPAAAEVTGAFGTNTDSSKQAEDRVGCECSGHSRLLRETRRDLSSNISEEEDETVQALEYLPPPVWECNEEPGVDIPLAVAGAARMGEVNAIPPTAEVNGDRLVTSVEEMGELMGLTFEREDGLDKETFHSLVQGWEQNNCKKSLSRKGERELRNLISYVNYDRRNSGRSERSSGSRRGEGRGDELVCYEA